MDDLGETFKGNVTKMTGGENNVGNEHREEI